MWKYSQIGGTWERRKRELDDDFQDVIQRQCRNRNGRWKDTACWQKDGRRRVLIVYVKIEAGWVRNEAIPDCRPGAAKIIWASASDSKATGNAYIKRLILYLLYISRLHIVYRGI